jgi:Family of unknown function (DUF5693)
VNRLDRRTRFAAFLLLIALLASLVVAVDRITIERDTRRVELAMDYADFLALAHSYNYKPLSFLLKLRRAGLTSLAVNEELGNSLLGSSSKNAFAISGLALMDSARISPIANPTLSALVSSRHVRDGSVYLLVYDKATFRRYMQQLPLRFERSGITVLHAAAPYVIALRTQSDYFSTAALGIPADYVALARRLHLFIIPRFQNDERLSDGQIDTMFADVRGGKWISTVIFFGLRNQVLGFPDHINDTAHVFITHKSMNYGEIETYDSSQVQKGNAELAKLIPGRTVRVQAIGKAELDKLSVPEIVARYELGVRERNVRVVYLRPFAHEYNKLSIERTNVEIVRQLADNLRSDGFVLGRATPIPLYRGNSRVLVGLATLAVPSIFVLLLGWYGWYGARGWLWALPAYAVTIALYLGGVLTHHDLLARSIVALFAALLFATASFSVLQDAFFAQPQRRFGAQFARSFGWTLLATAVALLGGLTVVGLMSSPLTMEEVEPFRGVKLVLAAPPLIALALYLFTDRFNSGVGSAREAFSAPIRIYQLLLAAAVFGAAALVLMRSGNTSDVSPSSFELALRHYLTEALNVRPRFKEFLVGFPVLMLLPALRSTDRRAIGVLLSLAIGVGIGDIIDTFSHLHTPLLISLLRVFNGLVIGVLIGCIAIAVYRRIALLTVWGHAEPVEGLPPQREPVEV